MDQERIAVLLSKLMAGEATFQEQKELESAFREDPSLRETWKVIRELKELPAAGMSPEEEQKMLEKGLKRLDFNRRDWGALSAVRRHEEAPVPDTVGQEEVPAVRRMPDYRWMLAAASVLVLVIAGALLYAGNKTGKKTIPLSATPVVAKELVSKYGSRSFIELPDGSKLWLNAGSKVQYPSAFAEGKRELTLSGEAFFDIKHDPVHPFVIHTGKLDVRVLGTILNIKAYPGDSLTETTLIKGKVEVDFANNSHSAIVLKPSQKLIVSTGGASELVQSHHTVATPDKEQTSPKFVTAPLIPDPKDGTIAETSWVENKLVFRSEPFAQLALKLERWYNVKIRFDNEKYRMDELTGTFKDQRIDEVMHALQLTSDFHYKISGDTIHIW
jgi:ferric-dicitrate binding protein FerR (iron transport regulator)